MAERIDSVRRDLFIDSPGDLLVGEMVALLKLVPQFKTIFADEMYSYKRMDFSIRSLPALRIYNDNVEKPDESWFVTGDIKCDVLLPANLRREDLQLVQDVISSALLQQFRRTKFFNAVSDKVPGLNELGRRFSIDKSLGFEWDDVEVPLTQIVLNFKLDLRQWDTHLEETNRTKDDPFEETLGNLTKLVGVIQGLRNDGTVEVETKQDIGGLNGTE